MCSTSLRKDLAPASPCVARRTCRSQPAPPAPTRGCCARGNGPYPQHMCNTRSIALLPRLGRSLPCGVKQLGGRRRHLCRGGTGDTRPRDRSGSEISESGTRSRAGAGSGAAASQGESYWRGRGDESGGMRRRERFAPQRVDFSQPFLGTSGAGPSQNSRSIRTPILEPRIQELRNSQDRSNPTAAPANPIGDHWRAERHGPTSECEPDPSSETPQPKYPKRHPPPGLRESHGSDRLPQRG